MTWLFTDEDFKNFKTDSTGDIETHSPTDRDDSVQVDFLNIFEEDDELEFDIINIDTNLLRVPKLLSYDSFQRRG